MRITAGDVEKELDRIGYRLKPLDIVLVQTRADAAWGRRVISRQGTGHRPESTLYLIEGCQWPNHQTHSISAVPWR